jgi:hypothetical protein
MRDYLEGNKLPLQEQMPMKLEKINANKSLIYADTTHIFIKGFGWEIPKYIPQEEIGIIILKRDKNKVAESTHRVHSGPFNELGRDWIIFPHRHSVTRPPVSILEYKFLRLLLRAYWKYTSRKGNKEKKYPPFFKAKSIELIKWYYSETYALGEKYKKTFPKITTVDVDLDEINTYNGFEKIVNAFDLTPYYSRERLAGIIGKPLNLKENIRTE